MAPFAAPATLIEGPPPPGVTISRKEVDVDKLPSFIVTVIVAVPVWFAAGVTVTVRLAPPPPNAMFATGTNVDAAALEAGRRLQGIRRQLPADATDPSIFKADPNATPIKGYDQAKRNSS